jgi:hypothetical protein
MPEKRGSKWFVDDGPGFDRFGTVLGLSVLSVTLLSLIDLNDTSSGLRSRLGWVFVTLTVAATLVASLRASGVARRPRRIVEVLLLLGILVTFILIAAGVTTGTDAGWGLEPGDPSLLWSLVAMISPIVVLRRVLRQSTITISTLQGAVAVYLLLALAFNYAFLGLDNLSGGVPFFGDLESTSSFMYFSLSTITTVGYGDLAAVTDIGRFLASAEAVLGQVLLVTVVARLVSMYSSSSGPQLSSTEQSSTATVE